MPAKNAQVSTRPKAIVTRLRRVSLHDEIVAILRRMILEGTLAPGERIAEPLLCMQLGISRTPLREALKVLASEGLVELLPHRGAMVTQVTVEEVADLFEIMRPLERLAGALFATRASNEDIRELQAMHARMVGFHDRGRRDEYFALNQDIHRRIVAFCRNAVLAEAYSGYLDKIQRARYLANMSQARWDESVREHEEFMGALAARDGARLGDLLEEHCRRTGEVVIAAVKAMSGLSGARRRAAKRSVRP